MTEHAPELEESSVACFAEGTEGDLARCVVDGAFEAAVSPTITGLLIAATLLVSMYIAGDGTIVVPAVVTILFGGALIPLLPGQYATLAYTVVVIGATVAAFGAYSRFAGQGGF